MDKVLEIFRMKVWLAIPIGKICVNGRFILTIISGDSRKGRVPERKFGSTGNLTGRDIIG